MPGHSSSQPVVELRIWLNHATLAVPQSSARVALCFNPCKKAQTWNSALVATKLQLKYDTVSPITIPFHPVALFPAPNVTFPDSMASKPHRATLKPGAGQ